MITHKNIIYNVQKEHMTDDTNSFGKRQKIMPASRYPTHDNEDIWENMYVKKVSQSNIAKKKQYRKKRDISNAFKTHVSGTDVKNYLLKDPLLDWLEHFYPLNFLDIQGMPKTQKKTTIVTRSKKRKFVDITKEISHLFTLFENGNEFEHKVIEYLYEKFNDEMLVVNSTGRSGMSRYNFRKTKKAMLDGIPIIVQAVLYNDKNNTMGVADLLVRSDYINKLCNNSVLSTTEETYKAKNLSGNYHYRVIDIKWTTMILCADGKNIRNEGRFPAYKGQLAIYNCAMGEIQGYIPRQAYVMAKSWKIDKKGFEEEGYNCFDMLGVIDYNKFDYQFVEKTAEAIQWVKEVRMYGASWDPLKPHREELYPNASNTFDAPWTKIKKEISKQLDEITQIWYVSVPDRIEAHKNGVMKWTDPNCTSKLLGINGEYKSRVIDAILNINRSDTDVLMPPKIQNNMLNWQQKSCVDFYVDFETANECLSSSEINILNAKKEPDIIFMIGVGHEVNGKWIYENFTAENLTKKDEKKIINNFTKYIKDKSKELDPEGKYAPRLFHWSPAEVNNFEHAQKRHEFKWDDWETTIYWLDMYSVFTSEPIVVKGSLNFKLKNIGGAFYNLGLIETVWDDNGPVDGFVAMLAAIKYYNTNENCRDNVMHTIIKYNEIDCKVIWDIVRYLRAHNI